MKTETLDTTNCQKVVELVHMAFREGLIEEGETWKLVVLIQKGDDEFWEIGIVDVLWKTVVVILNPHLGVHINLHEVLHGF